jgi:hypothetical protein
VADGVGLFSTKAVKLTLDNTGPEVTDLKIDDKDRIINRGVTVSAELVEKEQILKAAEYFLDQVLEPGQGTPLTPKDNRFDKKSENIKFSIKPQTLTQGKHVVYIRACNAAGRWGAIASLPFAVDSKPPVAGGVRVDYPAGRSVYRNGDILRISVTLHDEGVGMDHSAILLNAANLGGSKKTLMNDQGKDGDLTAGDNMYTAQFPVKAKNSGRQQFTITAADRVPNQVTLTGQAAVDTKPPDLKIAVKELAGKLKGKVTKPVINLSGLCKSTDVVSVSLDCTNQKKALEGTPVAIPVTASRTFRYTITTLKPGLNVVAVKAVDSAGNEAIQKCEITLEAGTKK